MPPAARRRLPRHCHQCGTTYDEGRSSCCGLPTTTRGPDGEKLYDEGEAAVTNDLLDRVLEREADLLEKADHASHTPVPRPHDPRSGGTERDPASHGAEGDVARGTSGELPGTRFEALQMADGRWMVEATGTADWIQTMVDALGNANAVEHWIGEGRP